MKIRVTMKDPDTMRDAVYSAVQEQVKQMGLPDDEAESLIDMRCEKEREKMGKWFEYGEYLTCEFDTETMSATVIERK